MNEALEQRARQMLAHVFCCDPAELSKDEVRAARAVLAYQASEPEASLVTELAGQLESMDRANEQLRAAIYAMMRRLTELLDEDQFAELDALALRAGLRPPSEPMEADR